MASAQGREDREEQYLLRVQDRALASRIRSVLREHPAADSKDLQLELTFEDEQPRQGTLKVGSNVFPVSVLDLPTIVESYKTFDDVNLVKATDVGQVLLVREQGSLPPDGPEAKHGITPPMREARRRHFRQLPEADPAVVEQVEKDLLTVLAGEAPRGVEFVDTEEEYMVDAQGHGSWQQVGGKK